MIECSFICCHLMQLCNSRVNMGGVAWQAEGKTVTWPLTTLYSSQMCSAHILNIPGWLLMLHYYIISPCCYFRLLMGRKLKRLWHWKALWCSKRFRSTFFTQTRSNDSYNLLGTLPHTELDHWSIQCTLTDKQPLSLRDGYFPGLPRTAWDWTWNLLHAEHVLKH